MRNSLLLSGKRTSRHHEISDAQPRGEEHRHPQKHRRSKTPERPMDTEDEDPPTENDNNNETNVNENDNDGSDGDVMTLLKRLITDQSYLMKTTNAIDQRTKKISVLEKGLREVSEGQRQHGERLTKIEKQQKEHLQKCDILEARLNKLEKSPDKRYTGSAESEASTRATVDVGQEMPPFHKRTTAVVGGFEEYSDRSDIIKDIETAIERLSDKQHVTSIDAFNGSNRGTVSFISPATMWTFIKQARKEGLSSSDGNSLWCSVHATPSERQTRACVARGARILEAAVKEKGMDIGSGLIIRWAQKKFIFRKKLVASISDDNVLQLVRENLDWLTSDEADQVVAAYAEQTAAAFAHRANSS